MVQSSLASRVHVGIGVPSYLNITPPPTPPNGRALTINFSNAEIGIGPAQQLPAGEILGQTALQTKVVTLHIPYPTDQPRVKMRMVLRGLVAPIQAEAGVAVQLVACAGDTTTVVDLLN